MKKKMLINVADEEESRVAIVEDGILEEFTIETASKEQIKGNIYNGVIVKVEPSLQAAFVDYGGKRHGFLPMGEIHESWFTGNDPHASDRDRRLRAGAGGALQSAQRADSSVDRAGSPAQLSGWRADPVPGHSADSAAADLSHEIGRAHV